MSRKISLNLCDKEVVDNLNIMCEERGITISDFVREAIQEKYDTKKKYKNRTISNEMIIGTET